MPLPLRLEAEGAQRLFEIAGPGRLELLEEVERRATGSSCRAPAGRLCVSRSLNASMTTRSMLTSPIKRQRRRHLLGVVQLGRVAEIHRQAVVDQHVEVQVFLFHEQANEKAFEPGEQVPVEKAQIVADDVIAIVGELDALALLLAAALALHAAEENLA